jgi:hypothetical protein
MDGLLQPVHLFFILLIVMVLAGMFLFATLIVAGVFYLDRRGKPPRRGLAKDKRDFNDGLSGGLNGSC